MTPDFSVVQAEFARQVRALDQLTVAVSVCGGMDPTSPSTIGGRELPILDADAENVMAAAAIVSLAAYFESFVRAQVEEYARGVVFHYANLHAESQTQIVDSYWKSSLLSLGRLKPKEDPQWATKATASVNSLIKFPIAGDPNFADPTFLSDHDHNMRFEVLSNLAGRVGVKKLGESLYRYAPLKAHIGAANQNDFLEDCKLRMFHFQELRNTLVHQISQASGVGLSVYAAHRDFIRLFAEAFTATLTNKYPIFAARAVAGNAKLTA